VEGWQVSGIWTAQTGSPLDVIESSSLVESRPDFIGGNPYNGGGDPLLWLNPAAFAQVPISKASGDTVRPGNVGRNALRGPGSWNLDIGLGKTFSFTERAKLNFRVDAFNGANHVNLNNPSVDMTKSNFGKITSAANARTVQMNLRMTF
jgi:hypothetical protein